MLKRIYWGFWAATFVAAVAGAIFKDIDILFGWMFIFVASMAGISDGRRDAERSRMRKQAREDEGQMKARLLAALEKTETTK